MVVPEMTTAVGALALRRAGIRRSRSKDKEDSSNHGNGENSSNHKGSRSGFVIAGCGRGGRQLWRWRRSTLAVPGDADGHGHSAQASQIPVTHFLPWVGKGAIDKRIDKLLQHNKSVIIFGTFLYDT